VGASLLHPDVIEEEQKLGSLFFKGLSIHEVRTLMTSSPLNTITLATPEFWEDTVKPL
jgi:hypothetical protein